MITIEQVLEVLKKDHNFRDIINQEYYYYSWTGVTFDHLSYDSRDITPSTLFFAKGAGFKLEFLESAVQAGLGFYVAEKDYQASYESRCSGLLPTPSRQTKTTSLYWYKREDNSVLLCL